MKSVSAIAMLAALALTASAAHATSKYHKRHAHHVRAPVVVAPAPSWGSGPARPPDPYRCYQDEGYGRWTECGQGARGR
jgi:hypothetical protein